MVDVDVYRIISHTTVNKHIVSVNPSMPKISCKLLLDFKSVLLFFQFFSLL